MNHKPLLILFLMLFVQFVAAQDYSDYFVDKTLRVDYLFSGNAGKQTIVLDELSVLPSWAGRRTKLSEFPLEGNGQLVMKDAVSGKVIYVTSFSTLFQEWLVEDEAKKLSRGFENTYLLPYPKNPVEITVTLLNNRRQVMTEFTHLVTPDDILIRKKGDSLVTPHRYLIKSGDAKDCIDVVILAEGYTKNEMSLFLKDADAACTSIFSHEPFKSLKSRFNVIVVESASAESGVSVPGKGEWLNTVFSSHFNTFYSDRYLTTSRVKDIHNALAGIPYEHIIILANTDVYGGGGIYNAFTLTTAHHHSFAPVVVHEFGHSFAGLGDEYYYENKAMFSDMYPTDIEPWEHNITTLVNFDSKWKDMLPEDTSIPTKVKNNEPYAVGVYEGAGYSSKGIYRPAVDCRMKTNTATRFCPVCQRTITRLIEFYTK